MSVTTAMVQKANWVCKQCGKKHGVGIDKKKQVIYATWFDGICDICEKRKLVTGFKTYGYAKV